MSAAKPRLVFVSPVFLFPNDAGGKIRTTNILRGLKDGAFEVTLLSPATSEQMQRWSKEIEGVCDEFVAWTPPQPRPNWRRALDLGGALPINVVADRTAEGMAAVQALAKRPDIDLMVFDFVHSAVLRPAALACRSVCFTHNVEAEIFARHASQARDPLRRWMWSSQHEKMRRFERAALRDFDAVVAVSDRDARFFKESYGVAESFAIPTGVDLEFFGFQPPPADAAKAPPTVVFTGSMDWAANIDGIQFFLGQVWPLVLAGRPDARFVIVGRNPPASLRALAQGLDNVEFTGFVDDVRPYVHAAHAFVIPLLVGGGTRIKAFEAMAMGCPVVSTAIGIEGLGAEAGTHYLERDDAASMAAALLDLLGNETLRNELAHQARTLVEQRFGHEKAARVFEQICLHALKKDVAAADASAAPLPPALALP
ncbi:glycosyltransferase [Massilia sp. R2A-15]|uniref:glycosyltransferase n=1 Tax=Massilia sp. R2A-15 TaxID=3064278 RepID=UPI00273590E9|nr:glycosyltransferase [Massilia sp. R2A-15]WLI88938.1 glycosyltransferase [Massilia sp. R2A-15]